jgi:hypothetical protein
MTHGLNSTGERRKEVDVKDRIIVDLKGGPLNHEDSVSFKGEEIPNITKIELSASFDGVTQLNIFTIIPKVKVQLEAQNVIIHRLEIGGATIEDYDSLLAERNMLRDRLRVLEDND